MKKTICILLALLCMTPAPAFTEELPEQLTLAVGESRRFTLPFSGYWDSDAPEVADAEGDTVTAHEEGYAVLALIGEDGNEFIVEVEVTAASDPVPALIRNAIDTAVREWRENLGKTFSREPRYNKYTKWWGYECGWCGAFASYCLDAAGVPLEPTDTYKKVKPTADGEPHGLREAAVPKLDTGFGNMDRLTQDDPRPGYLVIYGRRDSKSNGNTVSAYAFVHVGLITDVRDLGEGRFLLSTVEGNLSSRIKRFTYVYDANAPANKNKPDAKTNNNMSAAPQEYQTDPDIQYEPHQATWYVTEFCRTWY